MATRDTAYTTPRPDVAELVPRDALSILDVGCSNGALGATLRAAVPGRHVAGLEMDVAYAMQAANKIDRVIRTDLEAFDWHTGLDGERFDCIIFADVLEHVRYPERHLTGAIGSLASHGCIVVSLPNIRHLSALASIYGRGHFPRRDRGLFDATHLRWFTISDARSLLSQTGLEIDAESYSLRAGDRGGGRLNRALNRLPPHVKDWPMIREFLSYQFCFRARPSVVAKISHSRV